MLNYTLPRAGSFVLTLHDISGRRLAILADGWGTSGHHTLSFNSQKNPAGVYLFRLESSGAVRTVKGVILK